MTVSPRLSTTPSPYVVGPADRFGDLAALTRYLKAELAKVAHATNTLAVMTPQPAVKAPPEVADGMVRLPGISSRRRIAGCPRASIMPSATPTRSSRPTASSATRSVSETRLLAPPATSPRTTISSARMPAPSIRTTRTTRTRPTTSSGKALPSIPGSSSTTTPAS